MTIAATRQGDPVSTTAHPRAPIPGDAVPDAAGPDGAVVDGTVQYLRIGDLELESGARLPDVTLGYAKVSVH